MHSGPGTRNKDFTIPFSDLRHPVWLNNTIQGPHTFVPWSTVSTVEQEHGRLPDVRTSPKWSRGRHVRQRFHGHPVRTSLPAARCMRVLQLPVGTAQVRDQLGESRDQPRWRHQQRWVAVLRAWRIYNRPGNDIYLLTYLQVTYCPKFQAVFFVFTLLFTQCTANGEI